MVFVFVSGPLLLLLRLLFIYLFIYSFVTFFGKLRLLQIQAAGSLDFSNDVHSFFIF